VIEEILKTYESSTYDFRTRAFPHDPLAHLFSSWVPYYRLKHSIAKVLRPATILEVGVRYGYSARAFLDASENSHYIGIDLNSNDFGGSEGAIEWARSVLPADRTTLLVADTQQMSVFPGGMYDLIHVDGQQDGDGTYHDLELACRQGRYVLVDGFLWTAQNFRAAGEFLFQHKQSIEYFWVIPGYAGELLIKIKDRVAAPSVTAASIDSRAIQNLYDSSYYLQDCGGWDYFAESGGRELSDLRLRCVFDLAMMRSPLRVLDLGCGRGEIAVQAAVHGCEVVAIDYSADAIAIAQRSARALPDAVRAKLTFKCDDATKVELTAPADVVVAGDLIEHMAARELDVLYANILQQLAPNGIFVIHTFPNRWYYDYDYKRRRRVAASVGAYLPQNPRSRYEQLMHINEQSPRTLRRQLSAYFPHVLVWVGAFDDAAASLRRKLSPREMAGQRDLFAVASRRPISSDQICDVFVNRKLSHDDISRVKISAQASSATVQAGSKLHNLGVTVFNGSPRTLSSYYPQPVHLSYHILRLPSRELMLFEGQRNRLVPALVHGATRTYHPSVIVPTEPGRYLLQLTLVQEGVAWFESVPNWTAVEVELHVTI
jgi:2-polyprenyl-3-methyl-5-hydroxy-6-metoxy-1,4-benzoquinol methylase/predicted O-methyltransferase YrrM